MRLPRGVLLGFATLICAGIVASCGPGTNGPIVVLTPGPSAPTPPAIPTSAPTTAIQLVALATPASGATQPPLAAPTVAGYAGSIALPAPTSVPANTDLVETVSNAAIDTASIPTVESALRAGASSSRSAVSTTGLLTLWYIKVASSSTVGFSNLPSISLSVPPSTIVPGVSYYLAVFDLLRSGLGWQKDWEGPATISGTTLTFAAPTPAIPLNLTAEVPLYVTLYAVSSSVATPTPAPSVSPGPTPIPLAAFTITPSTLSFLAASGTATATVADPSGYAGSYVVSSSAASVATASVSGTTVTVSAVGGGTATITVADTNGRTAAIAVTVTPTNVTVQGGRP